jgi:hypothetical protein
VSGWQLGYGYVELEKWPATGNKQEWDLVLESGWIEFDVTLI